MKRFLMALLLGSVSLFADGTVRQSLNQLGTTNTWVLSYQWTGDASTGTVPITAAALNSCGCQGYLFSQVEVVPLSPAPTAGYSVAILDAGGADVLDGAAASLSASSPQAFAAAASATPLQGTFRLSISGQSVASARGTVFVFLSKPGTVNLATLGRGGGATSTANWLTLANSPFLDPRRYNWAPQSPGGSLAVGANTIILNPMPTGINATSINAAKVYISGGTGTAEAPTITGWTATTITFSCANTHSGAWSVQSASLGIQEAFRSATVTSGLGSGPSVYLPSGQYTIRGTITCDNYCSIIGAGNNSTVLLKGFATGDLLFIGSSSMLSGVGGIVKDLQIRVLPGITDTSGYAIHVNWRYNVTVQNVTIYGDPNVGIGQINNGVKFENALTFSLLNTKILNVVNIGLELASTPPDQTTGRIVAVDVTSPSVNNDLVFMHGNILSLFIDGLQMQGGLNNWEVLTTGGAFTESTISNLVFDSASGTAFKLSGTGNTFKLNFNNIILSTIQGVPSTVGMSFDGTGAGVFTAITVNNVTGGVNASNQIGTALIVIGASNFLLSNSQIQGAGGGVGDTSIQIQGTTNNVIMTGNVIGYAYDGSTTGSQAYRGVYVPSGTHKNLTIDASNRIYGSSSSFAIAGAHTALYIAARLEGGAPSWTGTGSYQFDYSGYIPSETGSNNAIAGTLAGVPLLPGVRWHVLLAHTLQVGANTFNPNATGALAIKSHYNTANDIATAYASGGIISLVYDGTQFLDMSQ